MFGNDTRSDLSFILNCSRFEFISHWSNLSFLDEALYLDCALWNNQNNCHFNSFCKSLAVIFNNVISLDGEYRAMQQRPVEVHVA